MRLDGKTAVVTGGGQGIGAAVVRALADAGASVVVSGRTLSKLERIAEELRGEGRNVWAAGCDVSDPASILRLAAVAKEKLGPVDILVNNAGIAHSAPIARTSLEDWEKMMRINATGAFLCLQAFLPDMLERKWGRIVNVASMAGLMGMPYIIAYAASKHALVGLTRAAAAEVGKHGVTVNAVCPGYVETPMTEATIENVVRKTGKSAEEARAAILSTMPAGRMIQPDEVATAVLALVTDEQGRRNGEAVVIDGGEGTPMSWDIINPRGQPKGWNDGLLSPAGGRTLFVAGQTASDGSGRVEPADFVTQFRLALANSLAVVRAAGGQPTDIGRMTVYVLDMEEYRACRRELAGVWKELMGKHYPAMALVEVSALLDEHALLEMETTAVVHHQDRRLV